MICNDNQDGATILRFNEFIQRQGVIARVTESPETYLFLNCDYSQEYANSDY